MVLKPGIRSKDHYASLNRRMWAVTFDSIVFLTIIWPFQPMLGWLQLSTTQSIDLIGFRQQLALLATPWERLDFFWQTFYDSGHFAQFLIDTSVQSALFCVMTGICWRLWSTTPGKMLLRMRVVDAATEAPISGRQIILRLMGYYISTFGLFFGFFWVMFDRRRQGWHDKIADTAVVIGRRVATPDSATDRP
jgi:hypothetical protein